MTAVIVAAGTMGGVALEAFAASLDPQLLDHGLVAIAAHLGLAAALWGCVYSAARLLLSMRRAPRTVRLSKGSVMVETLIVLPILLLLISGLSQLTLVNVAGLLSNLAGYNAGRAVWVWDAQGVSDAECEQRAVDAAAHAVAPSVSDDFVGASGSRAGDGPSLIYAAAYDTGANVEARAPGKLKFAQKSVEVAIVRGPRVGAHMTYRFHIAFPWFAYIWGEPDTVGGRTGYFAPIEREYTLPRQPS